MELLSNSCTSTGVLFPGVFVEGVLFVGVPFVEEPFDGVTLVVVPLDGIPFCGCWIGRSSICWRNRAITCSILSIFPIF